MLVDDAPADVQPQPAAVTARPGAEERVEDARAQLVGNAGARVVEGDERAAAVRPGTHLDDAGVAHGVDGIVEQVDEHLVERGRARQDAALEAEAAADVDGAGGAMTK